MAEEAEIREAIDKLAIQEMTARYNRAADAGDGKAFSAFFTEDGVLETVGMPAAVGREAIEHHLGRASNWVHLTMNPIIEIDGDTATQDVMLLFGYRRDDRKDCGIIATARYEDKLVRTPDGWKFTERRCFNDLDPEITFQRLPELLR